MGHPGDSGGTFLQNVGKLTYYMCWHPALVSGEHTNMNRLIYSLINAGQSKIYFNFTFKLIT